MRGALRERPDAEELYASASAEVEGRGPGGRYFRLLDAATAAGSIEAASDLAEWLLEGHRVLPAAPRRAVELLRRAAARGHPGALFTLANCYADGIGTRRSLPAAARCYRRSARAGEAFAAANLATLYRDRGNRGRERFWLHRASALGDELSALVIAEMDLVGRSKDAARRARRYLERMTRSDDEAARDEAAEILDHFARTGLRRWHCSPSRAVGGRL